MKKIAVFLRAVEMHHIRFFVADAAFVILIIVFSSLPMPPAVKAIMLISCFVGLSFLTVELCRFLKAEIYFSGLFDGMDKHDKYLENQTEELTQLLLEIKLIIEEEKENDQTEITENP